MTRHQAASIQYCLSIGLDPQEAVIGYDTELYGYRVRKILPRWMWYVGAIPEA